VADQWEETVAKDPSAPSLIYAGDAERGEFTMSFADVDTAANRVANWALKQGMQRGDTAAIFMENRPEFVCTWLGFAKIGVVTAWINNTIKLQPLVHSISISQARMLVFGSELADIVGAVHGDLTKGGIAVHCEGGSAPFCTSMDSDLVAQPSTPPPTSLRKGTQYTDTMCYIYTSGTTGLPKAAIISHQKWCGTGMTGLAFLTPSDRIYGSGMPLYHSAAGMIGIGNMVCVGCSYLIRRRFSASLWLQDVKAHGVTVAQYIGELARYILSLPEAADDADNALRFCIGNGLRPEYWDKFQMRFGIDMILEFYGATEGTGGFNNAILLDNLKKGDYTGYGSVGQLLNPLICFARYDVEEDALVRNAAGFCEKAVVGEAGEMIVRVTPETQFTGYTDVAATKKKILTDVFEQGDTYTRTGDLMKVDEGNWVYFVDRIGDTFRWKGENVSTAEVASELSKFKGVEEVNVYGVQIPNNEDGRAGMCAMILKEGASTESLARFLSHAKANLPSYAVPVFLRMLPAMQITGTFKHQKVQMRKDGIDVQDPIYFLENNAYHIMDDEAYGRITSRGGLRARL